MTKKRFELDSKMEDELSNIFYRLILDGGVLAVEDILRVLSEELQHVSDIAYDQASIELGRSSKQGYQKLGNELLVISQRLEKLVKTGFVYT